MTDQSVLEADFRAHQERNRALMKELLSHGIGLGKERLVDLHFFAPTQESARKLAEALAQLKEHDLEQIEVGPTDRLWSVTARLREQPLVVISEEFIWTFLRTADQFGCVFDGWGTALVEL